MPWAMVSMGRRGWRSRWVDLVDRVFPMGMMGRFDGGADDVGVVLLTELGPWYRVVVGGRYGMVPGRDQRGEHVIGSGVAGGPAGRGATGDRRFWGCRSSCSIVTAGLSSRSATI